MKIQFQINEEFDYQNVLDASVLAIADRVEEGRSYASLAVASGLSCRTVRNLLEGKTRSPHFRTVAILANAVGLSLSFATVGKPRKAAPAYRPGPNVVPRAITL